MRNLTKSKNFIKNNRIMEKLILFEVKWSAFRSILSLNSNFNKRIGFWFFIKVHSQPINAYDISKFLTWNTKERIKKQKALKTKKRRMNRLNEREMMPSRGGTATIVGTQSTKLRMKVDKRVGEWLMTMKLAISLRFTETINSGLWKYNRSCFYISIMCT